MTLDIIKIRARMLQDANLKQANNFKIFFKNCDDDIFIGVPAANIKKIAKEFYSISFNSIENLMQSNIHEERSLAHAILRIKFNKSDERMRESIFNFYIKNKKHIKDWDGVDDSAPYIVGPFLLNRDKKILNDLAQSSHIWDRRIAIVSTWHFIRNNKFDDTIKIAKFLLGDNEDLIHKAVGWMLRELGKRNVNLLKSFLDSHATSMPRTMLRYAIERFDESERRFYLQLHN